MSEHLFAELWRIYQDIWDLVPIGIHVIDDNGRTQVYNQMMGEIDGYEPSQAVSKSLFELFQLTKDTSTLWKALTTGEQVHIRQQVYFTRNGRRVVTRNQTKPLLYDGRVIGAIEISTPLSLADRNRKDRIDHADQKGQNARSERPGQSHLFTLDQIIGQSDSIEKARYIAKRAARTNSTVLIFGETGVGKELFAQGLHSAGNRAGKPFVPQNCAALPASLLEGILFGTRRGGFTGAIDRAGLFEVADGGTLLFDEIHTLDIQLQAKLLRVLQERAILPVGSVQPVPIDVRVITTMNIHPAEAIERGMLREDLFYRLNVVHIHVPPLRERREDISLLANHFVQKYSNMYQIQILGIEPDVIRWFSEYDWPGNVRQLEHLIEGAINMADPGDSITMGLITTLLDLLPTRPRPDESLANEQRASLEGIKEEKQEEPRTQRWREQRVEAKNAKSEEKGVRSSKRQIITEDEVRNIFLRSSGNVSETARVLGISRQRLQYYLHKYQLK
jgi:arginine utilization regulatory protein